MAKAILSRRELIANAAAAFLGGGAIALAVPDMEARAKERREAEFLALLKQMTPEEKRLLIRAMSAVREVGSDRAARRAVMAERREAVARSG